MTKRANKEFEQSISKPISGDYTENLAKEEEAILSMLIIKFIIKKIGFKTYVISAFGCRPNTSVVSVLFSAPMNSMYSPILVHLGIV